MRQGSSLGCLGRSLTTETRRQMAATRILSLKPGAQVLLGFRGAQGRSAGVTRRHRGAGLRLRTLEGVCGPTLQLRTGGALLLRGRRDHVHKRRHCSGSCGVSGGSGACGGRWPRGVPGTPVRCDPAAPWLVLENFCPCSSPGRTLRRQSTVGSADLTFVPTLPTPSKQTSYRDRSDGEDHMCRIH